MKPWIANMVGRVALRFPKSGAAVWALAAAITSSAVPPPNDWLSALKWPMKSVRLPMSRTRNATNVPAIAMMKKPFCQRNVAFAPRMRMTVWSTTIASEATRIHVWSVVKEPPQLDNVALLVRVPRATRTGPSANTAKNFAKNAAPARPPKIIAVLEMRPSGGHRIRLTQT